jgi:hypothetical protein
MYLEEGSIQFFLSTSVYYLALKYVERSLGLRKYDDVDV